MGGNVAKNIIRAGFKTVIHDLRPERHETIWRWARLGRKAHWPLPEMMPEMLHRFDLRPELYRDGERLPEGLTMTTPPPKPSSTPSRPS